MQNSMSLEIPIPRLVQTWPDPAPGGSLGCTLPLILKGLMSRFPAISTYMGLGGWGGWAGTQGLEGCASLYLKNRGIKLSSISFMKN